MPKQLTKTGDEYSNNYETSQMINILTDFVDYEIFISQL